MIQDWERTCFIQRETAKLHYLMISTFSSTGGNWIYSQKWVFVEGAGRVVLVRKGTPIKTIFKYL